MTTNNNNNNNSVTINDTIIQTMETTSSTAAAAATTTTTTTTAKGKELITMNYSILSMRKMKESTIQEHFSKVYQENRIHAMKWLFYIRDCRKRNGQGKEGERRLFRSCFNYVIKEHLEVAKIVLPLIPDYGRWDDILSFMQSPLEDDVVALIKNQLEKDKRNMKMNNRKNAISLCAKWMPSVNTSSKETKKLAHQLIQKLKMTERQYRKTLSTLRSYLKIVEVDLSAKKWNNIDYSIVPFKANFKYQKAFLKHDEERRIAYLTKIKEEEEEEKVAEKMFKLLPHEIVHEYQTNTTDSKVKRNNRLELLWKNLFHKEEMDGNNGNGYTICITDNSQRMLKDKVSKAITCMEIAHAFTLYFSERFSGPHFKNHYITFNSNPHFIDLKTCTNLKEKLEFLHSYQFEENCNLEEVYHLILKHAMDHHLGREELPSTLLLLSNNIFDQKISIGNKSEKPTKAFFETMKIKFEAMGYTLPKLIVWNLQGDESNTTTTPTIPIIENDMGISYINGFTSEISNMILSNTFDVYDHLLKQLNTKRYQAIEDALIKEILLTKHPSHPKSFF